MTKELFCMFNQKALLHVSIIIGLLMLGAKAQAGVCKIPDYRTKSDVMVTVNYWDKSLYTEEGLNAFIKKWSLGKWVSSYLKDQLKGAIHDEAKDKMRLYFGDLAVENSGKMLDLAELLSSTDPYAAIRADLIRMQVYYSAASQIKEATDSFWALTVGASRWIEVGAVLKNSPMATIATSDLSGLYIQSVKNEIHDINEQKHADGLKKAICMEYAGKGKDFFFHVYNVTKSSCADIQHNFQKEFGYVGGAFDIKDLFINGSKYTDPDACVQDAKISGFSGIASQIASQLFDKKFGTSILATPTFTGGAGMNHVVVVLEPK